MEHAASDWENQDPYIVHMDYLFSDNKENYQQSNLFFSPPSHQTASFFKGFNKWGPRLLIPCLSKLLEYLAVICLFSSEGQQLVFIRHQIMIHTKKKMVKMNKKGVLVVLWFVPGGVKVKNPSCSSDHCKLNPFHHIHEWNPAVFS